VHGIHRRHREIAALDRWPVADIAVGEFGAGVSVSGAAEEMLECPTCGAFVAITGAKSCGKADCPYPG